MSEHATIIPADAPDPKPAGDDKVRVLLVTGMSGAGKTSALKALEDMDYEAVDNVPLVLLSSLVLPGQRDFQARGFRRPLAIGIDIRTRDFGVEPFRQEIDRLRDESEVEVQVLFLDCDDDELRRRYAETRHRHPLAADRPVADGIARERPLMEGLRDRAEVVLDTTGLGPGDLKRILRGTYAPDSEPGLAVFVTSFSFRRGLPRGADLVFDVRFLTNPHYDPELRPLTGRDDAVAAFIDADAGYQQFFDSLTGLLGPLLPRYVAEGKSYLTIAVGCTGGRHRSVFVAERLGVWLESLDQRVQLHHRDLEREQGESAQ